MALERRTPLARGTKGLSPGKPLAQGKPLARTSAPARRSALPRARTPDQGERANTPPRTPPRTQRTPPPRRTASTTSTPRRRTGATQGVRELVLKRDGGLCVRCGAPATNVHHRQGRGAGGTKGEESARINGPAWLVCVCGQGNTSGCHAALDADREAAQREGYVLARNGVRREAALMPIRTPTGWVLHDDEGGRSVCPEPPEGDARNSPA